MKAKKKMRLTGLIMVGLAGGSWPEAKAQAPPLPLASEPIARDVASLQEARASYFVASGDHDTSLTSWNGLTWQPETSAPTNDPRVAQGAHLLVKVGVGPMIRISPDGRQWTEVISPSPSSLWAVAYGNGLFVAVGNEGVVLTSPDGRRWASRDSGTDERLRGIVSGCGQFVVVGYAGTILTSKDGLHWTRRDSGTDQRLLGIACGKGMFVAVGWRGTVMVSQDAVRWTQTHSGVSLHLRAVSYSAPVLIGADH